MITHLPSLLTSHPIYIGNAIWVYNIIPVAKAHSNGLQTNLLFYMDGVLDGGYVRGEDQDVDQTDDYIYGVGVYSSLGSLENGTHVLQMIVAESVLPLIGLAIMFDYAIYRSVSMPSFSKFLR